MKRLVFCAVLLFLCAGCYAPVSTVKPALTEEGEIFLYLEPLTPDARALRFTLEQVAAVRSDGTEAPLTLHRAEIKGDDSSRQRLLASGVLPPGGYLGFSVKLRQASLKNGPEEKPLLVSDKPERVAFPFEVKRKKGSLFSLTLAYREAVRTGSSFRPAFTVVVPPPPLVTLTGYVTNTGSNTVTVFDKRGGSVRRVIATGLRPMGIALDQKKMVAYVAISGEDAIEVIDLLSNEIVNRIRLTYGDRPGEIALTPDGKTLLVVNTGSNSVSFVDPATLLEISRLTVGKQPRSILLDPAGKKGYVFNYLSNTINVIDIANRTLNFAGVPTIPTESGPLRGAFSRLGDKLMVIHEWSPNLLVIDPVSSAILKRVYVGLGSGTLRVDTTTDRIYLSMRHDPVMQIYDPFSLIPGDFLDAAGGADYMLFDGETSNFLLVLPDQKALQAVNLISKKGEYLIDVGEEPFWSAIMGER